MEWLAIVVVGGIVGGLIAQGIMFGVRLLFWRNFLIKAEKRRAEVQAKSAEIIKFRKPRDHVEKS